MRFQDCPLLFCIPSSIIRIKLAEFTGPDSYLCYYLFIAFLNFKMTLKQAHGEFAITSQDFNSACVPVKGNVTQKCEQQVGRVEKSDPAKALV